MSATQPVELERIDGAQVLYDEIGAALVGELSASDLYRSLIPNRDVFLNLLSFKGNSAVSRAIIESGTVHTTQGIISLDKVPDLQEILTLSEELKIDELVSLAFVLAAQEQSGIVSAAAAAGLLYNERLSAVQSLLALLHAQVAYSSEDLPPDVYVTIAQFNATVLQNEENGYTVMVKRLIELIQTSSVLPYLDQESSSSRIPAVLDVYGRALDRVDIIQRECTALCQCLFYCCCIKQRMTGLDIGLLLDLLHHLSLHARSPGPHQFAAQHQADLVLLSILLTMLPLEDLEGQALAEDDKALVQLANLSSIDAKIRSHDDLYFATVRLGWGMLPLCCDDQSLTKRGIQDVKFALHAGALAYLGHGIMRGVVMKDADDDVSLTAASIVHQLLALFVEVAPEGMDQLRELSLKNAQAEMELSTQPQINTNGGVDNNAMVLIGGNSHAIRQNQYASSLVVTIHEPDTMATLLESLAVVIKIRPALFLDEDRRVPRLRDLMTEIGEDAALGNIPSIFVAYTDVLTALATTEVGARMVFTQLRGDNAPPLVSWRRMFSILQSIITRYNPTTVAEDNNQQRTPSDNVLPPPDTKALCAFALLFERVMSEGNADEVASWIRQLDDEAGVSPSWEVLFQTMCTPVPQSLKAALDRAIVSMARRPDLAAALWERLLACVVVQPFISPLSGGDAAVPRYDMIYQLNEIESRSEDYQESVAFVQLINGLWKASGISMPDGGRSVAHFTRFIRDDLLATVFQRSFKDESQRWELIAVCLEHCRLCLGALSAVPASSFINELSSGALVKAPGLEILLDLLEEKNAARAAFATLSIGVDALSAERYSTHAGGAKEHAVLEALRLLHAAFEYDKTFVEASRLSVQHGGYETFEAVLRHDRSRIPFFIEYVRYPLNRKVQEEALRLTTSIAMRTPHLVQLLLSPVPMSNVNEFGLPLEQRLQDSFASCLSDSVVSNVEQHRYESEDDPRASLVLELLLSSLILPTPNFAQLLCGFQVDRGTLPLLFSDYGSSLHTPLRVILDILSQSRNSVVRPRVFEQCLEVVCELGNADDTGPATLDLLRSYKNAFIPLIDDIACTPLPQNTKYRVTSLHQRAWLLQLYALELRCADAAVIAERESLAYLLGTLFGKSSEDKADGSMIQRGRFLDILTIAVSDLPAEPQLAGTNVAPDVRRMMHALEVESLLTSSDQGGVQSMGPRGVIMIDIPALKDELFNRFNNWIARHGSAGEVLKEAGRATLAYAAEYNAYSEEISGRMALLEACQAVISVTFTDRFGIIAELIGGGTNETTDLVLLQTEHALQATAITLRNPNAAGLAVPIASAVEALFARLHEQALSAATLNPLTGLPLPSRLYSLLNALLVILWEGRAQEAIRLTFYNACMSYLAMCKGPSLFHAPASIVCALLQGVGGAPERIDAMHLQLEEGNIAVLHNNVRLLHLLAQDAVSPNSVMSTTALTTLASLIGADPSTSIADELHRIALPARLLQDLEDQQPEAIVQPPPAGQAAVLVAEAKLSVLLRLALAGPPAQRSASAQKLVALQAIPRLAACRALDVQPEEPGFGGTSSSYGSSSLRQRLHHLVGPSLRLILTLSTALPHSAAVKDQAAGFVEAHSRAIARVIRDTASSDLHGWEPLNAEFEDATLAVQLLCQVIASVSPQTSPTLQEAVYRASARLLTSNAKSQCPPVVRITAAKESGTTSTEDEKTYAKILSLRCALASFLYTITSDGRTIFPCVSSTYSSIAPTLFLIKDALTQAAVIDLPDCLAEEASLVRALEKGTLLPSEESEASARLRMVRTASRKRMEITRLGLLIEHLLAILYQHLRGHSVQKKEQATLLKDLDQLRRLTEPAIAVLERLLIDGVLPGDVASFDLLIRRTKEQLVSVGQSSVMIAFG